MLCCCGVSYDEVLRNGRGAPAGSMPRRCARSHERGGRLVQELKKGPIRNPQQTGKGAGAGNATAAGNASSVADGADAVAGQRAGVDAVGQIEEASGSDGSISDGGISDGSISDAETASVSSADSVKDEL